MAKLVRDEPEVEKLRQRFHRLWGLYGLKSRRSQ
jgi:hypothetical protein